MRYKRDKVLQVVNKRCGGPCFYQGRTQGVCQASAPPQNRNFKKTQTF